MTINVLFETLDTCKNKVLTVPGIEHETQLLPVRNADHSAIQDLIFQNLKKYLISKYIIIFLIIYFKY